MAHTDDTAGDNSLTTIDGILYDVFDNNRSTPHDDRSLALMFVEARNQPGHIRSELIKAYRTVFADALGRLLAKGLIQRAAGGKFLFKVQA